MPADLELPVAAPSTSRREAKSRQDESFRPQKSPAPWQAVELSVVVAARDEAPNLESLIAEIRAALAGRFAFETIVVDDGSGDGTQAVLAALGERHPELVTRRHARACGQSAAMRTGILAARGPLIATIDGDGQNDPADLPALIEAYRAAPTGIGLVIGWRRERHDTWRKRMASRVANSVRARLLKDATPDTGCGLKVMARDTYLGLPYFDHMHRFLPALVRREGLLSISVPVRHRARRAGQSKYGVWDRALVGIVDLAGVLWLQRRRRLPD
jgi:dolichol-phosphate mannosyltransferase